MSRSIHQNLSGRYFRQHGPHSLEDWVAQFEKARIKRHVRMERKSPPRDDTPPVSPEAIRFVEEDLPSTLYFPATPEDVQDLLADLPLGFLDGVTCIRFEDGHRYLDAQRFDEDHVRDPIHGRRTVEIRPGIFAPIVLGAYQSATGLIRLFAYTRTASADLTLKQEMALKCRMLYTLVHELAHNQDATRRVARGRWRMDDGKKAEDYAEKVAKELLRSVVLPYIERKYAHEIGSDPDS